MPEQIIISDASVLIALADIGKLEILRELYNNITITDVVRNEVHAELPDWVIVSTNYDPQQMQVLELELDAGEASAIALAMKIPNSTLILDESKGRIADKRLGLKVTGTVGIIIKAKRRGIIQSGKEILDALEEHGFWLSQKLKADILERLEE
ncbi:MAG: DUF3368 domain-containing protein [Bacteroidota bacterium]